MKTNRLLPAISLFVFICLTASIAAAGQFKVVRVYDGDTVKVAGHDIEIKIRLVGIDSPETSRKKQIPGQPYSQESKRHLAGLVLNKIVDIKGYGLGPYNRVLGVVSVDGKNVNLEMVKAGLVEVYRGRSPKGFDLVPYREAERDARDAKRGAWSLGDRYISPKVWRARKTTN